MTKMLDADVLIIGGGAAGTKAALELHEQGLKVLMVVKGFLGRSGCSIFATNLLATPDESPQAGTEEQIHRQMDFLAKYTHYLGDQEYLKQATLYNIREFFPWLEERGLYVRRMPDGTLIKNLPKGLQTWAPKMGTSGTVIMDILRKEVLRKGIKVLEETTATSLLTNDGTVVGATALDYRNGELLIIRAKATILASGHSNYLSLRSTGTRDGSASGWVMAYRVGATLQNLEMQWYHVSDIARPRAWMRLHLYPNPLPATAERAHLHNTDGEFFFSGNMYPDNAAPYYMQLKHLYKEVQRGKARWDGGYYTSYRHIDPKVIEKFIYQSQFYKKLGYDVTRDMIECGLTYHMNVGGIRVNGQTMESGVPGLFIAGSVGALVTGGLPNVMYDGRVAARYAGERAHCLPSPEMNSKQVQVEEARVFGQLRTEPREGYLPAQVKRQIRETMWKYMGYVKSEATLNEGLRQLQRVRTEVVPKMRLGSDTRRFNYDWVDALDVADMLEACELQMCFSLHRKESRGAFYREDYPITDNEHWLCHVLGHQEDGRLKIETKPVDLPYTKPKERQADFFALDY
ncbi:MAG: FAD-binding protein [Chloroflexi bacterium]|nr:FAD-binding protein [Chloroflexota bacterium]MCL5075880.1 FAD-binding protein [Chloroflexota bacterium]